MALNLSREDQTFVVKDADLAGVSDPDPDVTYTLRLVTRETLKRIRAERTKPKLDRHTRQMVDVLDDVSAEEDVLDHAVVAWTGWLDGGQPAACTRENKLALDMLRQRALINLASESRRDEVARSASFRSAS